MTKLIDPIQWTQHRKQATGWLDPPILYVAHPVAPRDGEVLARCTRCKAEHTFARADVVDLRNVCDHDDRVHPTDSAAEIVGYNLRRALAWWSWLEGSLTEIVFAMPWYVNVTANGNGDPDRVARGLRDDCEIVQRFDGLVLCGSRVSSGMHKEALSAIAAHKPVFQIASVLGKVPTPNAREVLWQEWAP